VFAASVAVMLYLTARRSNLTYEMQNILNQKQYWASVMGKITMVSSQDPEAGRAGTRKYQYMEQYRALVQHYEKQLDMRLKLINSQLQAIEQQLQGVEKQVQQGAKSFAMSGVA
jgi:hypothetical protein